MDKKEREMHIGNLRLLIEEHADNDAIFETLNECIASLRQPSVHEEFALAVSRLFVYWQVGRLEHKDYDQNMQNLLGINNDDILMFEDLYDNMDKEDKSNEN